MSVVFRHESGSPVYTVPGYFAADGRAAETSATAGTVWRAHLSPDKTGTWHYRVRFVKGLMSAIDPAAGLPLRPFDGQTGSFEVAETDKSSPDFRARGRLAYLGDRYLRFLGDGTGFLKAGPDSPETLLAYADFDNTRASLERSPLKTWVAHLQDWQPGDPAWQNGKGKGLIGALNYLASEGLNSFSFLPYNVGGDGDNVWPFAGKDDKLRYDVSKLEQWGIVFAHGQRLGLHLHFKLQETEMDDLKFPNAVQDPNRNAPLDGGDLGPERMLYLRELVARFGHHLALTWNLGEENTQSYEQRRDMAAFLKQIDPYGHHVVLHTYPSSQDAVYNSLLGARSALTGPSLQNPWDAVHQRTLQWIEASERAGKPWVVTNDEQNPANFGVPIDPDYPAASESAAPPYSLHDIRKYTLWGNLMAGGAGVEYYFGWITPGNDLNNEDFRTRDQSWDYCRIALGFFRDHDIPFTRMRNDNALIGNPDNTNERYCFAEPGEVYLVYLPDGGTSELDLSSTGSRFQVRWFNPREGGRLLKGSVHQVAGGSRVNLGTPPTDPSEDWLVMVRRR